MFVYKTAMRVVVVVVVVVQVCRGRSENLKREEKHGKEREELHLACEDWR